MATKSISSMKVDELRSALLAKTLDTSGPKVDLVARLEEAIEASKPSLKVWRATVASGRLEGLTVTVGAATFPLRADQSAEIRNWYGGSHDPEWLKLDSQGRPSHFFAQDGSVNALGLSVNAHENPAPEGEPPAKKMSTTAKSLAGSGSGGGTSVTASASTAITTVALPLEATPVDPIAARLFKPGSVGSGLTGSDGCTWVLLEASKTIVKFSPSGVIALTVLCRPPFDAPTSIAVPKEGSTLFVAGAGGHLHELQQTDGSFVRTLEQTVQRTLLHDLNVTHITDGTYFLASTYCPDEVTYWTFGRLPTEPGGKVKFITMQIMLSECLTDVQCQGFKPTCKWVGDGLFAILTTGRVGHGNFSLDEDPNEMCIAIHDFTQIKECEEWTYEPNFCYEAINMDWADDEPNRAYDFSLPLSESIQLNDENGLSDSDGNCLAFSLDSIEIGADWKADVVVSLTPYQECFEGWPQFKYFGISSSFRFQVGVRGVRLPSGERPPRDVHVYDLG